MQGKHEHQPTPMEDAGEHTGTQSQEAKKQETSTRKRSFAATESIAAVPAVAAEKQDEKRKRTENQLNGLVPTPMEDVGEHAGAQSQEAKKQETSTRKRSFAATESTIAGVPAVAAEKQDERRKRTENELNGLVLRQKSIAELQQILAQTSSLSIRSYSKFIEELSYRCKGSSKSYELTTVVSLAFASFNKNFKSWVKEGVFDREDYTILDAVIKIPYHLNNLAYYASGFINEPVQHAALKLLVNYVAQRCEKFGSNKISQCLYGIGGLARGKGISKGCYSSKDIEQLLGQLRKSSTRKGDEFSSALLGLNWLCANKAWSVNVSAEVINDLLSELTQEQVLTEKNISCTIESLGYIASAGALQGTIKADYLEALFDSFYFLNNSESHFVNITHGLSMLIEANAVQGLISKEVSVKVIDFYNKMIESRRSFRAFDISHILFNLSVLLQQHPRPNPNDLLPIELNLLVHYVGQQYQHEQELERSISALTKLKFYIQIDIRSVYSLMDALLNRQLQEGKFSLYLSYFVAFKDDCRELNPLFEKLLRQLTLPWTRFCPSDRQEIQQAIYELKDTPWHNALCKKFNFSPSVPMQGTLTPRALTFQTPLAGSLNSTPPFTPRVLVPHTPVQGSLTAPAFTFQDTTTSSRNSTTPFTPRPLVPSTITPRLLVPSTISPLTTTSSVAQTPEGTSSTPLFSPGVKSTTDATKKTIIPRKIPKTGVSLVSMFHRPTAPTGKETVPIKTPEEKRKEAWVKACKNKIFSAIATKDLLSLEGLLGLLTKSTPVAGTTRSVSERKSAPSTPKPAHEINRLLRLRQELQQAESKAEMVDILAKEFFNTETDPLRRLIVQSKALYFDKLLHACSKHMRYELAEDGKLDPVLLYLPFVELRPLVTGLIKPHGIGIHVASKAVIKLIKALDERAKNSSLEQKVELHELQKLMLDAAGETHKHHSIVSIDIKTELRRVQAALRKAQEEVKRTKEGAKSGSGNQNPAPALRVNCNYLYESEDVEAILKARLKDTPNVEVLAGAYMNDNAQNNRVKDVLRNYFKENPQLLVNNAQKTVIIPIEKGGHWYGLKLTLTGHTVTGIRYYNSLQNEGDVGFRSSIAAELRGDRLISDQIVVTPAYSMQQPDSTSCGPYLIENIYCDVIGRRWSHPNPMQLCEHFRQRHLEVLKQHRPDYYPGFNHRQANNIVTVKRNGIPTSTPQTASATSKPGFFNSEPMNIDSDISKSVAAAASV